MDISQMVIQFAPEFANALWKLLWALGNAVGLSYLGGVLLKFIRASKQPNQQNQFSFGESLMVVLVAVLLYNLNKTIGFTWNSFGSGMISYGPISYDMGSESGRLNEVVGAVLTLVSVFGGCFCFKGLLLLKKGSTGGSSHGAEDYVWSAFTHIFFGAALVKIAETIDAFRTSFRLFW